MEEDKKTIRSQDEIDWENRRLCEDEACIGIIGSDGRCKECGKAEHAESREIEIVATADATRKKDNAFESEIQDDSDEADTDVDWENRRLCEDEACIGIIGPDGRCKECGKPEESKTAWKPDAAGETHG